ncbi:MAG: ATP synthase F0 subunit B [Desulfobacterales bacterium]|nr:ATP synthase F0 subunit B [Desulfobacterales bacterium]
MNRVDKKAGLCVYVIAFVLCCHIFAATAFAGEGDSDWRSKYDLIMMWLNFGILVFIIVKFGKTPLMNFLEKRKYELSREIGQLEKEKEKVAANIKNTFKTLDDSEAHFARLKEKIVEQGEKTKNAIIEDARGQSRIMLNMAKKKIESQIVQAKSTFRAEMVDAAIDMATERLPGQMTDDDNNKLLSTFLSADVLAD